MCMRVVQSVFSKKTANDVPPNMFGYVKYTAYYQGLAGVFATIVFLVGLFDGGSVTNFSQTFLYASVSGIALAVACMCSLYALGTGTMVLNSIFATAGLLVPVVASIFLYGEILQIWQWIGIAVFMLGAYLLVGSSKSLYGKFNIKTLLVLVLSLMMNGLTMLMQKMFGEGVTNGNVSLFSLISFGFGTIILLLFLLIVSIIGSSKFKRIENVDNAVEGFVFFPKSLAEKILPKKVYIYGLFLAVAVFVINQFATMATPLISSLILFAMINGGATVISAITGAVMFKERLTLKTCIGIVLSVGALIMIQI